MNTLAICLVLLAALPLGAQAPSGNPLVRKPAGAGEADPWLRSYSGEEISLELSGSPAAGYTGMLFFSGASYPISGRLNDGKLVGLFRAGEQSFAFEAVLAGDTLSLRSGGSEHQMRAVPAQKPVNPLERRKGEAARPRPEAVEAAGSAWRHPRGLFSFEMPHGWSVWRELEDGILLNPGLTETDSLDALIFLSRSELDQEERGLGMAELVRHGEPKLREQLAEQGIQVSPARGAPELLEVGGAAGAIQGWRGRAQSGAAVDVWLGVLVQDGHSLGLMAILVDGKGQRFKPQIERLFGTLRAATPPKNQTATLAGRSFSHSEFFPGSGSFHTLYEFRADGTVLKQMIVSGDVGGNTEEVGRYEIAGEEVALRFADGGSRARLVVEGGAVRALRFGNTLYKAR